VSAAEPGCLAAHEINDATGCFQSRGPTRAVPLACQTGRKTAVTSGQPRAPRTASNLGARRLTPCAKRPSKQSVAAKLGRPTTLDAGRYTPAMTIADRLNSLGIELPPPFPPAGNYLSCVIDEGLVYVGGHGPVAGDQMIRGKVGGDLTLEQGREAARMTALSILATLQAELGELDRIQRIIKVFGMVNVAPGFDQTPAVLDGCSDLLVEVFGNAGRHTRAAVGLAELPVGIAVEIELIARLRT
jgi:enamine deaminase RidA (YjgF/YER057c/UK114 family)